MSIQLAKFIPWLPALAALLCGLCCIRKPLRSLAAPICILAIFGAFLLSVTVSRGISPPPLIPPPTSPPSSAISVHEGSAHIAASTQAVAHTLPQAIVKAFDWIQVGGLNANMSYFLDPLTVIMLLVVTGVGTLVAIYASSYMAGDKGYARFFMAVSLFIFAMTSLVMADNLVLLYLGWEGVGLCSYLLIGYYYDKPSAVAAAKKAFIVNRIGDLGFALGIFLAYTTYGTVQLHTDDHKGILDLARLATTPGTADLWIPFLLMLGAFGKSAQIPLYVWLPDAMEGPTPVSALIHAATMVTAGVYLIARLLPLFVLSPYALPTVAIVGGVTALFAGSIALCQYDIKKVWAYSTVSQLGYMFLGVGALASVAGVFHLFTHAFFKALLFLTAGSVMHALTGQLDLRKMSGLWRKMPITAGLMLIGCLALAGFPFTSGFFSKDMILAAAMEKGLNGSALFMTLAIMGLVTAFMTAYYTFRLWFRVFLGPTKYEMGHDHHGDDAHDSHGHGHDAKDIHVEHHHDAHEMPWLMNAPLVVLAVGALLAGYFCKDWMQAMVQGSSASTIAFSHGEHHHVTLFGMDLHLAMEIISSLLGIAGISVAAYFHWLNRPAADQWAVRYRSVQKLLENKYYVDEVYQGMIVSPLRTAGHIFWAVDRLIIDGLVSLVGWVPRMLGLMVQPSQSGLLHGYGLGMVAGIAAIAWLIFLSIK